MRTTGFADGIRGRVRSLLERHVGVDTRSLAAFRIGLGSVLIVDLLLRARHLRTFYTDAGVLPVSFLAEQTPILARLSLHAYSGDAWFQGLLFAVAGACALSLLIGYRTRIATGASVFLLFSLHARNPYVLSGGDALLQHLLFWSLFLPLGETWSVDGRRREARRERVLSVGSAAILTQVLLVYGVNAALKLRSDRWTAGEAVAVVLGLDRYTSALGAYLHDLPVILRAASWAWVGLLLASPLLVLLTGWLRASLAGAFAGTHLGMLLTMDLGIFPLVSVVALVPFLPGVVWDRGAHTRPSRRLRAVTARLSARLAGVLPAGPVDRSLPPGRRGRLARATAGSVLAGLVVFNAIALGFVPVPPPADDVLSGRPSDSRWALFAPHPPETALWYVAPGERASGERVDAFRRPELRWERPGNVAGAYSSVRMRKYLGDVRGNERLRAPFVEYLCDRWNRDRAGELVEVSVYVVERPAPARADATRTELASGSCG